MTVYILKASATDWSDTSSWKGGVVPVSGATNVVLIEPDPAGQAPVALTAGLDQSAVSINKIVRQKGSRKPIGGNGEALQIGVDNGTAPMVVDMGGGGVAHAMYINGDCPQLEAGSGGAVYWMGGDVAQTLLKLDPGSHVEVGEGADFGTAADNGLVHNNGGTLIVKADSAGTDRIGTYYSTNGGNLHTKRDVAGGGQFGRSYVLFEESATIVNAAGNAQFIVAHPEAVIEFANDGDVSVDDIQGIAGRPVLDRLLGDFTLDDGLVNLAAFRFPTSIPGGAVDISGATTYGSDLPSNQI